MRMMNGYSLQIDLFDVNEFQSSDGFRLEHEGFMHFGGGDGATAVYNMFKDHCAEFRHWDTGWFAVRAYLVDGRDGEMLHNLVCMDRRTFAEYEQQVGSENVVDSLIAALPMKIFEADLHESPEKLANRLEEEK